MDLPPENQNHCHFWPNEIIFHQPRFFAEIRGPHFPYSTHHFGGQMVRQSVRSRFNLTRCMVKFTCVSLIFECNMYINIPSSLNHPIDPSWLIFAIFFFLCLKWHFWHLQSLVKQISEDTVVCLNLTEKTRLFPDEYRHLPDRIEVQ